jgi:hypothetical protein
MKKMETSLMKKDKRSCEREVETDSSQLFITNLVVSLRGWDESRLSIFS